MGERRIRHITVELTGAAPKVGLNELLYGTPHKEK